MSIVLEDLTKRYAGHPVVNGVSLTVGDGELFVLLGSSGSGKSTLLRMIAGLTEVDAGRVMATDLVNLAQRHENIPRRCIRIDKTDAGDEAVIKLVDLPSDLEAGHYLGMVYADERPIAVIHAVVG